MPKTVILADGNFDGLHFGHIAHLQAAKALGDWLVVALATDSTVAMQKGYGRPRFPYSARHDMLSALKYVDEIIPTEDSLELVASLRPNIYVKGMEYTNSDHPSHQKMVQLVKDYGGEVVYTDTMLGSSTQLLNHHIGFPPLIGDYLRNFKAHHTLAEVNTWLDQMQGIRTLVMGERITDIYHYMEPLGKSPKDSLISWQPIRTEQWDGGSTVIQEHLKGLGLEATLDFGDNPPVVKHRYLWGPQQNKIFAVIDPADIRSFHRPIFEAPLSIVADFGHGMFTAISAPLVAKGAGFLSLTCQANSSNWGFNLLSKWPRADYVVADEEELRLTRHDKYWPLEGLLEQEAERLGAKRFVVTQGHRGCLIWDGSESIHIPAFAGRVVDRLGSGDAFYAATAPLAFLGAPAEIIGLIGNLAGAIEVGAIGQKKLEIGELKKWVKGILL